MATATRDRILDAALHAFATRGVEGTPITDLEAAAGLAAGSGGFYRYFRTKDEVLAAVVRREMDRVDAANLEEEAAEPVPGGDPSAVIEARLGRGLATLRSLGPLMAILSREQGRIPELAAEVSERMLEAGLRHDAARLAPLLGDVEAAEAHDLVAVILSALVGYTLATGYFGTPPGGVEPDRFVAALAGLVAPLPTKERSL